MTSRSAIFVEPVMTRTVKSAESFCSYLHRIAANLAVDRLRRRRRQDLTVDGELEVAQAEPPPEDDRLAKLRQQVSRLPEALREVVLLFYFQDLSYSEMAQILSISEAAVNQRLNRARTRLRESFGVRQEPG